MGHSDAGVTLNVYTHASYAHAAEQMAEISQFRHSPEAKKDRGFAVGKQQVWWQQLKVTTPFATPLGGVVT